MAIYKHVSSKEIVRKVFRDMKPATADFVHDAIEWIGEALEHIGASAQLCRKQCVLDIKDHRACLPGDLYYINQVAVNTCVSPNVDNELDILNKQIDALNADLATYYDSVNELVSRTADGRYVSSLTTDDIDTFDTRYKTNTEQLREINSRIGVLSNVYFSDNTCLSPLQYGASTFHNSIHCDNCVNANVRYKDTYIIDCDHIKTSFSEGKVCISYMAFPIDEECYPLVPDDISYREAMFWYIYKKLLLSGTPGRNPKITYEFAEMMWQQYCAQARNAANYPDIDKYESFMNQWVRLVPDINSHQYFFETMNDREQFTEDNF